MFLDLGAKKNKKDTKITPRIRFVCAVCTSGPQDLCSVIIIAKKQTCMVLFHDIWNFLSLSNIDFSQLECIFKHFFLFNIRFFFLIAILKCSSTPSQILT